MRFNVDEILELALAIERTGEAFYRQAESKFQQPKLRETFRFLALEEVAHERTFAEMLARVGRLDASESRGEEYVAYLRAYVENVVFSQQKALDMLQTAESAEAVLRFAMQREQDSIHFYLELKELVPEAERGVLDRILDEERAHYRKLSALVSELPGQGAAAD